MTLNKRIVSTEGGVESKKISQIIHVMKGYPQGMTPKQISLRTRLNVNTIKSILPKIKKVRKIMRGLYKVDSEGDSTPSFHVELEDWNFHNLILRAEVDYGLVSPVDIDMGLVHAVFSVSKVGSAVLRVDTDFPINVSSLCLMHYIFNSVLDVYSIRPVAPRDLMVTTIEFNKDYKNLRLDGVQSVSLDNLVEQFKLYQKSIGLRVEHKTKVPMSVESIVDVLSNNPNSIELHLKLNEQSVALERLSKAVSRTDGLLSALLDRMERRK